MLTCKREPARTEEVEAMLGRAEGWLRILTALVRGGPNLEAVRELAGHSKLRTTQRYVLATGADLRTRWGGIRVTSGK
jgi:hypothetical protein